MPAHDWTRVAAGTFHAFHNAWITHLQETLNESVLQPPYYALGEQRAGETGPDVLTSQVGDEREDSSSAPPGAVALAKSPPRVSVVAEATQDAAFYLAKRRTLTIRHSSNDRVVALVEIVSPGKKHSRATIDALVDKAMSALVQGIHLLIVDLFGPSRNDPDGLHGLIWGYLESDEYTAPPDRPLTLAAYRASVPPTAFVEPLGIGAELPDMPLFLTREHYVNVPLEATYMASWRGMPQRWREVIDRGATPS